MYLQTYFTVYRLCGTKLRSPYLTPCTRTGVTNNSNRYIMVCTGDIPTCFKRLDETNIACLSAEIFVIFTHYILVAFLYRLN